jgi:hypothetical protein
MESDSTITVPAVSTLAIVKVSICGIASPPMPKIAPTASNTRKPAAHCAECLQECAAHRPATTAITIWSIPVSECRKPAVRLEVSCTPGCARVNGANSTPHNVNRMLGMVLAFIDTLLLITV